MLARHCMVLGLVACSACAAVRPGPGPQREAPRLLKVFLADFNDVPHPGRYTREYFDALFFGIGRPRRTPEGRPLAGSVREYFFDLSEGRIDIEGEVADWVRIDRDITRVPHWKRGMTPFGESWPVIVAETLRANGVVGEGAKEKLRLRDGRMPQLLVFLNTDWGVGGVNRGWPKLKEVLHRMKLGHLWDEAWLSLPSPYSSYSATIWRKAPRSKTDGTIDKVPPADELELFPLSIMMHEMGHQLAGLPDLYGPAYEPWGVFDLMGGPAARTHYSMTVSAYLRERKGWLRYTEMPRRTARDIVLWPLESHKQALRFAQGPDQESIVAATRWRLEYPHNYSQPPANKGPRLLLYRVDPAGRRRILHANRSQRKITTMIRRPEHYGEVWGEGKHTEITAATGPSSRNSLGELWWEFRGIRPGANGEMRLDAECRAVDLVQTTHRAEWTADGAEPVALGKLTPRGAHAVICTRPASDDEHRARVLHCQTQPGQALTGRFRLPARGPQRLYATVALPDAGAAEVIFSVQASGPATTVRLDAAVRRTTVVADLMAFSGDVALSVRPVGKGATARLEIAEAWLVGIPAAEADLVLLKPASASPGLLAEGAARLKDGLHYGPRVAQIRLGGAHGKKWVGEWRVTTPAGPSTLRALVGLSEGCPAGSRARVTLAAKHLERQWPLLRDLELLARGQEDARSDANLPAVIEALLPAALHGKEITVRLEASAVGAPPAVLAIPCLRICKQ
ncbi:MAG: hypothetical protein ISS72_04065 [Candidatus Brocadiae bacterium]|nr:hypothetical protein [Candidatus Brocadiia bacterium]